MRQIYTSPRLENIERMVALLNEHGIETRVTDRPVYQRASYNRPSFRDNDLQSWPKVWVSDANDLPRARELLRGMGIESAAEHFAANLQFSARAPSRGRNWGGRVRALLLLGIFGLLTVMTLRALGWL
ncbi:MAG: putative signal transducing protein [Metallibacterium sp.]|jgi:hypothetical protein|uniref:putative signal transducing protein n=1 Tax=Metallibacterium sp. TaxID=2940281 RepID=UPI00260ABB41|nr:DUF2007 domain-containing protein [Metallibacterium sp.]